MRKHLNHLFRALPRRVLLQTAGIAALAASLMVNAVVLGDLARAQPAPLLSAHDLQQIRQLDPLVDAIMTARETQRQRAQYMASQP